MLPTNSISRRSALCQDKFGIGAASICHDQHFRHRYVIEFQRIDNYFVNSFIPNGVSIEFVFLRFAKWLPGISFFMLPRLVKKPCLGPVAHDTRRIGELGQILG